jgi:hypothetical protein
VIQVRGFNGKLNRDDNPYRSPKNDHVDALNITRDAEGEGQDAIVSNILGNQEVPIGYLTSAIDSIADGTIITYNITFGGSFFTNADIQITSQDSVTLDTVTLTTARSLLSLPNIADQLFDNKNTSLTGVTYTKIVDGGIQISIDTAVSNLDYPSITKDIPGSYGAQKVIGNYADRVRNRQYYFVWDSAGYHQINYYDANTNTICNVMEDKTGTGGASVLNFNPSFRINHVDIIYNDTDGDLLFWTDGLNPPSKVNINKAIDGEYGDIQRSFLDVAKEPPSAPPYCVYEDDATVKVNNVTNRQFKFKYRFVYDDLEKSVTSAQSEVPIPKNYTNQANLTDPTKNADIFILVQTGAANVTRIEILAAESLGNTYTDFFLVTVLDKAELFLLNNDTAYFRFYNDQVYIPISIEESIQPFDFVPQKAYTQSLPNGTTLAYGAITEGYNLVNGVQSISNISTIQSFWVAPTSLVYTKIVYHPTLGKALELLVAGTPNSGEDFGIGVYNYAGTLGFYVNYITPNGATTTTLLVGLSLQLTTTIGLTIHTINGKNYFTGSALDNLEYSRLFYTPNLNVVVKSGNSVFAHDWSSKYNYGVVYFDEKGITNGAVSPISSSFSTSPYFETDSLDPNPYSALIPSQDFSIFNRPPIWASYFHIVRTKNLTKSSFLYWISERTFKDETQNQAGYQYAYISISTLLDYILSNPEYKNFGYEFVPGDRIRFTKLYNYDGTTRQLYNTVSNDFEIIDSVTKPQINGVEYQGQFIKIVLPQTSASFDFGGDTYANYLIELYTPNKSFGANNTLYYEFGQKYDIGNPHTENAFHFGSFSNQTANLSSPAIFNIIKGDSYFRYRLMPTGGTMKWIMNNSGGGIQSLGTAGGNLDSNTSNSTNYVPVSTPTAYNFGQGTGSKTVLINISNTSRTYSFRVKGTITLTSDASQTDSWLSINSDGPSVAQTSNKISIGSLTANQPVTKAFDITIQTTVGQDEIFCWVVGTDTLGSIANFWFVISGFEISLTENNPFYQGIIDPNFSDTFESSATPNGRAWIYDPNATQDFNPTLIRFSGEYQFGTTINNTNRFYDKNLDVYDRSKGSIKRMFIEGRNLYCFQEFDVGVVTILTQIVRDTAGNPLSAESDRLLNKIVYPYQGGYGVGNIPESFAYGKGAKYFVDNNKGVVCRLAADGITPISIVYKMNAFFIDKLKIYKEALAQDPPFLGYPTVYGAYDAFTNKYILSLSEVEVNDITQNPVTISFSESLGEIKGFESFLAYHPENMGALNNLFMTFLDGKLWKHDSNTYCNFYGDQYPAYIDVVFNDNPLDRKTYQAINQTGNTIWFCPLITSQATTGNVTQQSSLSEARFSLLEGQYSSAILRDSNSPGGLINGQTMHGNYLIVRFQKNSAGSFFFLNTASLKYINSQLNVR